jgi:hypothetical protein
MDGGHLQSQDPLQHARRHDPEVLLVGIWLFSMRRLLVMNSFMRPRSRPMPSGASANSIAPPEPPQADVQH